MITVGDVFDCIDRFAPFDRAADFDNPGNPAGRRQPYDQVAVIGADVRGDPPRPHHLGDGGQPLAQRWIHGWSSLPLSSREKPGPARLVPVICR